MLVDTARTPNRQKLQDENHRRTFPFSSPIVGNIRNILLGVCDRAKPQHPSHHSTGIAQHLVSYLVGTMLVLWEWEIEKFCGWRYGYAYTGFGSIPNRDDNHP